MSLARAAALVLAVLAVVVLVGRGRVEFRFEAPTGRSSTEPVPTGSFGIANVRVLVPAGEEGSPSLLSLLHGDELVYSTDSIGFSQSGDVVTYPVELFSAFEGEHRFAGLVRGVPMQATADLEHGWCQVVEATPGGEVAHCRVRLRTEAGGEPREAGTVWLKFRPGPHEGVIREVEWTDGQLLFDLPVGGRYYLSARSSRGREWGPLPELVPGEQEFVVQLTE